MILNVIWQMTLISIALLVSQFVVLSLFVARLQIILFWHFYCKVQKPKTVLVFQKSKQIFIIYQRSKSIMSIRLATVRFPWTLSHFCLSQVSFSVMICFFAAIYACFFRVFVVWHLFLLTMC